MTHIYDVDLVKHTKNIVNKRRKDIKPNEEIKGFLHDIDDENHVITPDEWWKQEFTGKEPGDLDSDWVYVNKPKYNDSTKH